MLECAGGGQNSGWTDAWKNNKESKEENANEVDLKATRLFFSNLFIKENYLTLGRMNMDGRGLKSKKDEELKGEWFL